MKQRSIEIKTHLAQLQKQFEEIKSHLVNSLQTLEKITEYVSDGLIFITNEGIISLYNHAAAMITETNQELIINTPFKEHFSDTLFGFSIEQALNDATIPGRIYLTLSNKKEIEVAPSRIPKRGILLLLNDRTQYKKLEINAQHNERMQLLGEMAASIAHEIRNPLAGIQGFASLLQRELSNTHHQKMIKEILHGSSMLNALITNVLDYSHPLTLHFTDTDMALWAEETANFSCVSGYPCKLSIQEKSHASIDQKYMQLVLLNLIRNSHEAGAKNVELLLTTNNQIVIKDDGKGIEPENLSKIFYPFFTTKTKGTGLGLSEAEKIIRAHGGRIRVDSKVGEGTSITLDYGS